MKHARTILLCTVALLGSLTVISAQADLRFEVISIRPLSNDGGAAFAGGTAVGAGTGAGSYFNFSGSVRNLIQQAYQIPFNRQIGGPSWIGDDSSDYRIAAKIPDGVTRTPENLRAMIRSMLAERFKLVARIEERTMPVYALTLARADKILGPNLTPVAPDCLVPGSACAKETRIGGGRGQLSGRNQNIKSIANGVFGLEGAVGRPVIERTGLTGVYDFTLKYAPPTLAATSSDLPTIFEALQDQLGLKLEAQQAQMPVVVIVSIEKPNEN